MPLEHAPSVNGDEPQNAARPGASQLATPESETATAPSMPIMDLQPWHWTSHGADGLAATPDPDHLTGSRSVDTDHGWDDLW